MKVFYNPSTVKQELEAVFDEVRKSDSGFQYSRLLFIGKDVYDAALNAFPGIFKRYEPSAANDYSGHRSKSALFAAKNKSRAEFVPEYYSQIYLDSDDSIRESWSDRGMTMLLSVDGRLFHMHFKNGQGATLTSLSEFLDYRDYYHYFPFNYDGKHPKPYQGIGALDDKKLDAWLAYINENQQTYDDIVKRLTDYNSDFIQSIRDNIDESLCDVYEVGDKKGTVIANNIKLEYTIGGYDSIEVTFEVYRKPSIEKAVNVFAQMTGTAKQTTEK